MKVFRLFKYKKYGTPIGQVIESKIKEGISPSKLNEVLNIVEERDDEDEKEASLALPLELTDNLWDDIVYEFILLQCDSVIRVHSFLQMVVVRKRYHKMKAASRVI